MADAGDTSTESMVGEDKHFVGDLEVSSKLIRLDRGMAWAPFTEGIRATAGGSESRDPAAGGFESRGPAARSVSVGVVATLFDVVASAPTLASCRPDWTATQDLSVHGAGWMQEGPVVVDASLVRVGKKAIVVRAEIYDGRGITDFDELQARIDASTGPTLVGRGLLTFARLPMSAISTHGFARPPAQIGEVQRRRVVAPPEGTVYDRMGLDVVDAASGVTELARTPYVTNSIGTMNGGAQCVMIQVAAEAMCPGLVATDLEVHFLSQVKVGPARSCGRVARHGADHSVITVELVDHGADDQVLSLATVTLQRPPA